MTFDKLSGKFKFKYNKIKDVILMQVVKTRMDNPKVTKTTIKLIKRYINIKIRKALLICQKNNFIRQVTTLIKE